MKKLFTSIIASAMIFAGCEKPDSDMPCLDINASTAPILANLSESISVEQDSYTFTYVAGGFVVDGQTMTLAEKDHNTQYCLQADIEESGFSNPVVVVKQNYDKTDQMTVSYETLCAALAPKCGLSETKTMWQGNVVFRIVMMPGSIVADGIASNYITVPATISYADPSTSIFLQTDAAGDYFVWAWNGDNGGEAYTEAGAWPGDKMTLLESGNNSYLYKYEFTVMPQNTPPANIIISTDNGNVKLFDGAAFENHKTFEYTKPAEVDPSEKQVYKLYIEDLSGWEQIALYTYGKSEIFGGWPGSANYTTETVAGIEFKVFEIEGAGESQTFIINNNGNGEQIDGPQITLNQNYYFTVADGTFKPTEFSFRFKAEAEGSYYVWAWGGDFGGESFTESGAWPGDALTLVGEEDGGFVYEYHFAKTPGIPPSNIIISTDNGDTKLYDGVEFVNGKQY